MCKEPEQFEALLRFNKIIENSDEMKIYEETGCLFSCEKFVYELHPKGSLTRDRGAFHTIFPEFEDVSDLIGVRLYFKSGDYMEYEQVRSKTAFLTSTQVQSALKSVIPLSTISTTSTA